MTTETHTADYRRPAGSPYRKDRVTMTIDRAVLSRLDAMARGEHRSRSAMAELIIRERVK